MKPKNLVKQDDTGYCFRIGVPKDLRPIIGKTELRYSLKERTMLPAKRKAQKLAKEVKAFYSSVRLDIEKKKSLDHQKVQDFLVNMIRQNIERMTAPDAGSPVGLVNSTQDKLDVLDFHIFDLCEALNAEDYRPVEKELDDTLKSLGVDFPKDSPEYKAAARTLMKGRIQEMREARDLVAGDFSFTFRQKVGAAKVAEKQKDSEPLGEIAAAYWDETCKARSWAKRTQVRYRTFQNELLNFFGSDMPIHMLTFDDSRKYKEHLATLTTQGGDNISLTTRDGYLGYSKAIWQYAIRHHYCDENIFSGLQVGKTGRKRADLQRKAFSRKDLETLFVKSDRYGKSKIARADQWFIPLISLFSGMRLEEICQLYTEDIKKVDGVWVFDVNDEDDKQVKTHEDRLVPVHDTLTEIGLLEYHKNLKDSKRLFPRLKYVNDKYGHTMSTNFGKWKTRLGFKAGHNFHSLRHTVATALSHAGVEHVLISQLLGHATSGETSRYAKRHTPKLLKSEVIDKLDHRINLDHLIGAWKTMD